MRACLVGYWVHSIVKLKPALVFGPHRAQRSGNNREGAGSGEQSMATASCLPDMLAQRLVWGPASLQDCGQTQSHKEMEGHKPCHA